MLPMMAALFAACSETDPALTVQEAETESPQSEIERTAGMTVLGERIPNAYTPEVMGEALAMLKAEMATNKCADIALDEAEVTATHLYLKFAPRDSVDVAQLDNDTTIMYTVLPMDYEVAEIGYYYHDPSLPDSVPTYQYCVARIGQPLPDVPHETLSELFLMEEANVFDENGDGDEAEPANKSVQASIWEELEDKALEIAGIAEISTNKSKWRPQGEVYYYDNSLGKSLPMEGVPVRISRGFVTHQCCTGKDGHFRFSRRRHHVRCYVKWRRDDFHLREIGHPIQQAESTLASHTKSSVSHTFTPGYDSWLLYASVFRAAHQYYYNYQAYGLSRPGDKNLIIRLSGKTSVSKLGCYENFAPLGLSDIKIYYKRSNNSSSMALFQTTAHEIAHSAHRLWSRSTYRNAQVKVKESWARGVEVHMARKFYKRKKNIENYTGNYTSVVPDLLDAGIPMSSIEQALRGSEKWETWRNNVARLNPSKKDKVYEVFKNCRN